MLNRIQIPLVILLVLLCISCSRTPIEREYISEFTGHQDIINSIDVSPDGRFMVSGADDHTLRYWDITSTTKLNKIQSQGHKVMSVCFDPSGTQVVRGLDSRGINLLDVVNGNTVRDYTLDRGVYSSWTVAVSPNGNLAVSGGMGNQLLLWDLHSGRLKHELISIRDGGLENILGADFSPMSDMMLAASSDHNAYLYDTATGTLITTLSGHTEDVSDVVFCPDEQHALTSSHDFTLRLWELASGTTVMIYEGHYSRVECVDVSPDGKYILSGSLDSSMRLWDLETGETIRIFDAHEQIQEPIMGLEYAMVNDVKFTADGQRGLSAGTDSRILLWELFP